MSSEGSRQAVNFIKGSHRRTEQSASMDEVASASHKLSELSQTLQDEAAKFRI